MQILKEDDSNWPVADRVGTQELEIILGQEHISFKTTKLGSLNQVNESKDPDGLRIFYYLVQVSFQNHFKYAILGLSHPSKNSANASESNSRRANVCFSFGQGRA